MDLQAKVSSIMTTEVECVNPDQRLVDLKHIYEKRSFHHHVPVIENSKIVGMVSLIDFMRAISYATLDDNEKVYQTMKVSDIMSGQPVTLDESATLREVAELLSSGDFSSVVITRNDQLAGIVTDTDLIRLMLK
ncbi:MAG: CBS domain-containing protein [Bacteroidetes bacterium]|nr:MAG: CBS domain-containing protein [Bacteroidota bacterium]